MKKETILITGAGGFLGRHIVPTLQAAGWPLRAMLRPGSPVPAWCGTGQVETIAADLQDPEALTQACRGCFAVVHLAALLNIPLETPAEKKRLNRINALGTENLLTACRETGVKEMIFISSVAAMGDPAPGAVADEATPNHPTREYGKSKMAAEEAIERARQEWGLKATTLRPVVVYGEGDKGNVVKMMTALRRRRFLLLAGGRAKKSLVYAGNLAAAVAHLLPIQPKWEGKTYISMDQAPYSMAELTRAMARAMQVSPPRLSIPALPLLLAGGLLELCCRPLGKRPLFSAHTVKKLTTDLLYSGALLAQETGFTAPFTLAEALARTTRWIEEEG